MIIAFLASICVTLVIILLLYLWEWLPPTQYNEIDIAITLFFSRHTSNVESDSDEEGSGNNEPDSGETGVRNEAENEAESDDSGECNFLPSLNIADLCGIRQSADLRYKDSNRANAKSGHDSEGNPKNDDNTNTDNYDISEHHSGNRAKCTDEIVDSCGTGRYNDGNKENSATVGLDNHDNRECRCDNVDIRGGRGSDRTDDDPQRRKNAMIAALRTLLANLTDQQLYFGLSVSLAIYIRLSDIDGFSAYSFKISTTSVWLSCLTQMAAVTSLQHHLYHHTGRAWRAAAMALQLVLLVPLLVLSNLPVFIFDPSLSFRCAWNQIPSYNSEQIRNFSLLAASAVVTIITGYGSTILTLHSRTIHRYDLGVRLRDGLDTGSRESELYSPDLSLMPWPLLLVKLLQHLRVSFLWRLLWLAFYLTFGITALIFSWKLIPPLEQWSVSFGQLVPLILLISIFPPAYDKYQGKSV